MVKQTLPDQALKPLWDEYQAVLNPKGALDGKTKQLIALGVAAQIPVHIAFTLPLKPQKPLVRPMLK